VGKSCDLILDDIGAGTVITTTFETTSRMAKKIEDVTRSEKTMDFNEGD